MITDLLSFISLRFIRESFVCWQVCGWVALRLLLCLDASCILFHSFPPEERISGKRGPSYTVGLHKQFLNGLSNWCLSPGSPESKAWDKVFWAGSLCVGRTCKPRYRSGGGEEWGQVLHSSNKWGSIPWHFLRIVLPCGSELSSPGEAGAAFIHWFQSHIDQSWLLKT